MLHKEELVPEYMRYDAERYTPTALATCSIVQMMHEIKGTVEFISNMVDEHRDAPEFAEYSLKLLNRYKAVVTRLLEATRDDSIEFGDKFGYLFAEPLILSQAEIEENQKIAEELKRMGLRTFEE